MDISALWITEVPIVAIAQISPITCLLLFLSLLSLSQPVGGSPTICTKAALNDVMAMFVDSPVLTADLRAVQEPM